MHFDNPWFAFLTVFTVLTGEDWPDIMLTTGHLSDSQITGVIYFLSLLFTSFSPSRPYLFLDSLCK